MRLSGSKLKIWLIAILVVLVLLGTLVATFYFQTQSDKTAIIPSSSLNALASSVQNNFLPELAIDGNLTARWASLVSDNRHTWFEIDFKSLQELSAIKIYFQEAYATKYNITTWNGDSWVPQIVVEHNLLFTPEHQFLQGTQTTKIRFFFSGEGRSELPWDMVSIYEIVLYTWAND